MPTSTAGSSGLKDFLPPLFVDRPLESPGEPRFSRLYGDKKTTKGRGVGENSKKGEKTQKNNSAS